MAGCGALPQLFTKPSPQVCFDRANAQKAWIRFQKFYMLVMTPQVEEAQKARIKNTKQKELIAFDDELRVFKVDVDFMFSNPGIEVDYDRLFELLFRAAELAR